MKKNIFCHIILFAITSSILFSQVRIYPPLPSDEISDIHFINQNEGIFINSGGGIFKSYDGGISWKQKKIYQGESFRKIKFLDENNGFILPNKPDNIGTIGLIVTSDGGENWRVENLSVTYTVDFLPVSQNVLLQSDRYGNILRLSNYYNQWDTVYTMPKFVIEDSMYGDTYHSYGIFSQLNLLPSGTILGLGNYQYAFERDTITDTLNVILKSTDSGLTWETQWSGLESRIEKLVMGSNEAGYFYTNNSSIYYTDDEGDSWHNMNLPAELNYIVDIAILPYNSIIVIDQYQTLISSNYGETWEIVSSNTSHYGALEYTPYGFGFVYGENFYRTSDWGHTWNSLNEHIDDNITCLDFVNTEIGFASGDHGFYKTYDGGKNWERIDSPPFNETPIAAYPNTIAMLDENYGYVSRWTRGDLLKTTDGGQSWSEVLLENNPDNIWGTYFFNESLGFINTATKSNSNSSDEELFHYITTDGGETWAIIQIDSSSKATFFDDMKFIEPNLLFAINRYGGLWKSIDTAKTWELIYNPGDYFNGGYSFDFFDETFGVLAISHWDNLITTDGGSNWDYFEKINGNFPTDFEILGKNISNEYVAYEIGKDGKLIKYNFGVDGRVNLKRALATGTNLTLNKIETFYNGNNLRTWVVGDGFNLFYRDHQLEITDIEEKDDEAPNNFTLSQNYPNPFNPSTTIKFTIPNVGEAYHASRNTKLIVFDILGREIKTLFNKKMQPGSYEIEFDGSNLTSGVYFYILETGGKRLSKKMLLVK